MDGNSGFAMAVDRSSGRYVSVAAWTDAKALEASGQSAPGVIADVVQRLHGSDPSVEVFELVLAHVVKPVRVEYWARLVRVDVPAEDLPRAVQRFTEVVLALFERYDGLAAIVVFVDRVEGALECLTWFDSLPSLRASASRSRELRDLLVAEIPTMRFGEASELEAVIAEMTQLPNVP
jgi:hypothetical protein